MAETTELKKSDFYFDLPQELIAQDPLEDRSSSRLLVLDKDTGEISHHIFRDIIDYLHPGDCLVLNNTKVIPARLLGEREGTGGHVSFLRKCRSRGHESDRRIQRTACEKMPGTQLHAVFRCQQCF